MWHGEFLRCVAVQMESTHVQGVNPAKLRSHPGAPPPRAPGSITPPRCGSRPFGPFQGRWPWLNYGRTFGAHLPLCFPVRYRGTGAPLPPCDSRLRGLSRTIAEDLLDLTQITRDPHPRQARQKIFTVSLCPQSRIEYRNHATVGFTSY